MLSCEPGLYLSCQLKHISRVTKHNMDHPTDRIVHTTAFVNADVEHWLDEK